MYDGAVRWRELGSVSSIFLAAILIATSCTSSDESSPFEMASVSLQQEVLADGFVVPFDVAIIADDILFITDRNGRLFRYEAGALRMIAGVPTVTTFNDPGLPSILHGGLMDIEAHPDYPTTPWLYASYFADGFLRVARFQVRNDAITDLEPVFVTRTAGFYGGGARIVWQDSQHFFLNVGGSSLSTVSAPNLIAQDLSQDWGKIHRIRADGSIPDDNPVLPEQSAPTTIYSYGHRDAQGLDFDRATGTFLALEHGPKGGDELNVVQAGGNYGWPLFTYGIDYSEAQVSLLGEAEAAEVSVLPEHFWVIPTEDGGQAIAPAFLLGLRDSNFASLNGRFLLSSLHYRQLLVYDRSAATTEALPVSGRIRSAAQLPSGDVLLLRERTAVGRTDGQLLRISPAN